MYLAAIRGLVHARCLVVSQGVCRDVGCLFQKFRTAEEGNGTIILGRPVLHQLCVYVWCKSEPEAEGGERQSGRSPSFLCNCFELLTRKCSYFHAKWLYEYRLRCI